MKHQLKPERWLCLATSFAMALDIPIADLLRDLGHDGSKIVFPSLPDPACRSGHHIQELIQLCLAKGFAATPVELHPITRNFGEPVQYHQIASEQDDWNRFTATIYSGRGVLEGFARLTGHAYAFDHGRIFNPDGGEFDFHRNACKLRHFLPRCAWLLSRIERNPR